VLPEHGLLWYYQGAHRGPKFIANSFGLCYIDASRAHHSALREGQTRREARTQS
jgi:hypothetical protein